MEYNHIYAPLADVYALGGPDVFTELSRKKEGKDLIVLPMEMIQQICQPQKHLGYMGIGGNDAIERIVSSESDGFENGRIFHVSKGLDVAVFTEGDSPSREPLPRHLIEKVQERFGRIDKVLTTSSEHRLRYRVMGLEVEKPSFLLVDSSVVEKGIINGRLSLLEKLYENNGRVSSEEASDLLNGERLYPNQFIRFPTVEGRHIYAQVTGDLIKKENRIQQEVENLRVEFIGREGILDTQLRIGRDSPRHSILGISPLDAEQYLAAQYGIFNPNMQIAFISGGASSGKTILGYVYGVEQILFNPNEEIRNRRGILGKRQYDQLVLLKPIDILGGEDRNVGYLKGTLWNKLRPHLEPFSDAHKESKVLNEEISFLDMFANPRKENEYSSSKRDNQVNINGCYLPESMEAIELTTTAFLRGRSFKRKLVIVDEFQNLTPYEAKTIIERLGEGSKLIAMGDPSQFDNSKCSRDINGFTYSIKYLLPHPLTVLVKLTHNYRREVSEAAREMKVYSR